MTTLLKPRFKRLPLGECAGAPILKALWDRFDFSLLLSQSGIHKDRGVPTWMLAFLYVVGLICQCLSVSKMASLAQSDALLLSMFRCLTVTQSAMSRFLTAGHNWSLFGRKRVQRLQDDEDTCLQEGDIIALDDTQLAHPYGKKLSFLCWLYDHSQKIHVWGMNLVSIHAILRNGIEYPLFYRIWRKPETKGEGPTKLDLAQEMLLQVREKLSLRLWVVMDRWYLCKDFFNFLTTHSFDWVTKAKRNTALFRLEIEPWSGRKRYVPINTRMLLRQAYAQLVFQATSGLVSIAIPNIYMKMPYEITNKKGKKVRKMRYEPIAAIAALCLQDADEETALEDDASEMPATYHGAYLLISNRVDAPQKALSAYTKRWRIEVFFRAAKQELGLNQCHSTTENHHHAHLELLFVAETLVSYALWHANKETTSDGEGFTHGKMVHSLFHTRCQIHIKTFHGLEQIQVIIDTQVGRFARLFVLFWPDEIRMSLIGRYYNWKQLTLTA